MSGFGPYASAKVPDRKYLWTVVALFGLLGLVGLGVLLYKPLMLQYAMGRIRASGYVDEPGLRPRPGDRWLDSCLDAARGGNRRAMALLAERALLWPAKPSVVDARDISVSRLFQAALAQPQLFIAVLDRCDDEQARKLVEHVTLSCCSGNFPASPNTILEFPSEVEEVLVVLRNGDDLPGPRLAGVVLDFTRRRFARELTEAAKGASKTKESPR